MNDIVEKLRTDADRWMSGDFGRDNEEAGMLSHDAANEIERLYTLARANNDLARRYADEITVLRARVEGLRGVIEHLENANDALAAKRSRSTYLAMEAEARDELIMLDEARRNARTALSTTEAK